MLSCAAENFSAKRFAEYLSLAQVPSLAIPEGSGGSRHSTWVASGDEVFGVLSEPAPDDSNEPATTTSDPQPMPPATRPLSPAR